MSDCHWFPPSEKVKILLKHSDGNIWTDLCTKRTAGALILIRYGCRWIAESVDCVAQNDKFPGAGNSAETTPFAAIDVNFYARHDGKLLVICTDLTAEEMPCVVMLRKIIINCACFYEKEG
jgi:hypothetical protein